MEYILKMDKEIKELKEHVMKLEERIAVLEGNGTKKTKQKRELSEKQKENMERRKKLFSELYPKMKKENPNMNSKELFACVNAKIKELKEK